MGLLDDSPGASASNLTEYSVSELSGALKRTVEDAFDHVRVRGEISGYRGPHSSGHAYFALKDDRARLEAVIWRTSFLKLAFKPEEGLEVIATGKLTTYPGSSKYQIVIETIEPAGAGALMALLNERRLRLEAEGLFAEARKRPLPSLPRVIGVVTSPTGAVIRDIRHRIADRFPVHLLVWPVRVQGETSGAEVAAAIAGFNALGEADAIPRPDLIIVARGGGSLEDLWGFNDEAVVRAAAASAIPLISAVGHETDWTLIDHAADRRAPTPTAAAEMAVPVKADLEAALAALHARHASAISRRLAEGRRTVAASSRALPTADMLLALPRRRLDEAATSIGRAFRMMVSERRRTFAETGLRLSPGTLDTLVREKRSDLRHATSRAEHGFETAIARRRQRFDRLVSVLRPHVVESAASPRATASTASPPASNRPSRRRRNAGAARSSPPAGWPRASAHCRCSSAAMRSSATQTTAPSHARQDFCPEPPSRSSSPTASGVPRSPWRTGRTGSSSSPGPSAESAPRRTAPRARKPAAEGQGTLF